MILTKSVIIRGKEVAVKDLPFTSGVKIDVVCPECQKQRSVHYRSVAKAGHTVCRSCINRRRALTLQPGEVFNMLTVQGPGRKPGHSVCRCECGQQREIDNYAIRFRQKSCGCIKASNFDTVNRPKGDKHGMWRGGTATERERTCQSKAYKDWRRKVLAAGLCRKCESKDDLQTHHIHDYDSYPGKRTEPENGVCLCGGCHREFHRLYGRKGTTKEHLEHYLEVSL